MKKDYFGIFVTHRRWLVNAVVEITVQFFLFLLESELFVCFVQLFTARKTVLTQKNPLWWKLFISRYFKITCNKIMSRKLKETSPFSLSRYKKWEILFIATPSLEDNFLLKTTFLLQMRQTFLPSTMLKTQHGYSEADALFQRKSEA